MDSNRDGTTILAPAHDVNNRQYDAGIVKDYHDRILMPSLEAQVAAHHAAAESHADIKECSGSLLLANTSSQMKADIAENVID